MCLLKKCCCCCSLRTGCWIIAILSLIAYILATIGLLYNAFNYYQPNSLAEFIEQGEGEDPVVVTKFWSDVVFCVVGLISSIFLIHGTKSSNVKSMWVFFYVQLVYIILCFVICILLFVLGFFWTDAVPYFIGPLFNIYTISVVKSYIVELKDQNSGFGGVKFSDIEASN